MLEFDPKKRATAHAMLSHPWLEHDGTRPPALSPEQSHSSEHREHKRSRYA